MTLSAPSLFAAASSAGSPPSAWALVAEAAETPLLPPAELELVDDEGGEQAATAARLAVTAARAAADAPRRRGERGGRMGTFLLQVPGPVDPARGRSEQNVYHGHYGGNITRQATI